MTTSAAPVYVAVPESMVEAAYLAAMKYAQRMAAKHPAASEAIIDRSTDGILYARSHAFNTDTFAAFAQSVVATFVRRAIGHSARRAAQRPVTLSIDAPQRGDDDDLLDSMKPTGNAAIPPLLIAGLPEDLAFVCRLYFLDGFQLRDVGLLTGLTANQVMRRLRTAAAILNPEGAKRPTTADAKRFWRG